VSSKERKKLFKYLLAVEESTFEKASQRCHHHHQQSAAAAHQKYHFNLNDFYKYLSRFWVWLQHLHFLLLLNASGWNNWEVLTEKVLK
jgi:hypothetical protein